MADALKFLKYLEYLFIIIILITLGYVAYAYFSKENMLEISMPTSRAKEDKMISLEDIPNIDLNAFETYNQKMSSRDIFSKTKVMDIKQATPAGQLPDNLKVVGIVLGKEPQVVVEDSNLRQTYFINQDPSAIGISIKQIDKNKIILKYQDENIEVLMKGNEVNVAR